MRDNVFDHTGLGVNGGGYFSDWSCGETCVAQNPQQPLECPSHGNLFRYNRLESADAGGFQAGFIRGPVAPTHRPARRRLHE